jgi:hypothetical protein
MTSAEDLLRCYPRTRPELPAAHRRIYEQEYKLNRGGDAAVEGLAKKFEGWMHAKVATQNGGPVLELGAGNLNHLVWEKDIATYDVVEPFSALYAENPASTAVRAFYDSIHDVPDDNRYSRIVSVAVLEHMTDLPYELARAGLMLEEGGVFQAGIPSEGGFLWWLGWRMTTGLSYYARNRLDYRFMMRHEHVNTAAEVMTLVRYFFRDVTLSRFPTPFHHASLYGYLEARHPDLARCRQIVSDRDPP